MEWTRPGFWVSWMWAWRITFLYGTYLQDVLQISELPNCIWLLIFQTLFTDYGVDNHEDGTGFGHFSHSSWKCKWKCVAGNKASLNSFIYHTWLINSFGMELLRKRDNPEDRVSWYLLALNAVPSAYCKSSIIMSTRNIFLLAF